MKLHLWINKWNYVSHHFFFSFLLLLLFEVRKKSSKFHHHDCTKQWSSDSIIVYITLHMHIHMLISIFSCFWIQREKKIREILNCKIGHQHQHIQINFAYWMAFNGGDTHCTFVQAVIGFIEACTPTYMFSMRRESGPEGWIVCSSSKKSMNKIMLPSPWIHHNYYSTSMQPKSHSTCMGFCRYESHTCIVLVMQVKDRGTNLLHSECMIWSNNNDWQFVICWKHDHIKRHVADMLP